MKKLLFAICMLFGVAVAAHAQDTTSTQNEPSTDYRTQEDPNDEATQDQPAQDDQMTQDQPTQDDQETGVSQDPTTQDTDTDAAREADAEPLAVSELPAMIRQSLESQEYSGWTATEAHKKEKDGKVFYKVKMQNGAETKKVKFDEQGNKLEEKSGDHKDHQ